MKQLVYMADLRGLTGRTEHLVQTSCKLDRNDTFRIHNKRYLCIGSEYNRTEIDVEPDVLISYFKLVGGIDDNQTTP